MKYTDLTEEQRKHFDMLVEEYEIPRDATHFDMEDDGTTTWVHQGGGSWYVSRSCTKYCPVGDVEELDFIPIPEKPWYDPTDVGFKNSKEESQMIGKWYTVVDHGSDYVNLTGECVDYNNNFGLVALKFPHKGMVTFTMDQLVEEGVDQDCGGIHEDMVKRPNHYQLLPEYEVKDINKALLDKIQESDFDMSLYEAGWYQQAMQYFLRFYAKGGLQDLEKGVETMQFVIDSLKERKGE